MMKRDQIKIVKTKDGGDNEDRRAREKPGTFRDLNSGNVVWRRVHQAVRYGGFVGQAPLTTVA
jgi:hypothetical protein